MHGSNWFVIGLCVVYALSTFVYVYEGNWPKVLYFGGSAILTTGVLFMK